MADILLTMDEYVSYDDIKRIVEMAKGMNLEDELTVSFNNTEAYKVENIFSVLQDNNFDLTSKGGHDGRYYYIIAKKRN